MTKSILRVGVMNNFNHTKREIEQVEALKKKGYRPFVNTNAKTEIKYGPAIVTINPDIDVFIEPKGNISLIKACRVKYVLDAEPKTKKAIEDAIEWCKAHNIPILITMMRFKSKISLQSYTTRQPGVSCSYIWERSYYRPTSKPEEFEHICDRKGEGCPSCQLCSILTFNVKETPDGINLSTSGKCPYNCPDCYSKRLLMRRHPCFDKIYKNKKQKGKVK